MTSREYSVKKNKKCWKVNKQIEEYVKKLDKANIDSSLYFKDTSKFLYNGTKKSSFEIKDKGLKLLESNVDKSECVQYCKKNIEESIEDKSLFPKWVYRNLKDFGNCSINPKLLDLGEERLLNELRKNGFDCCIRIANKYMQLSSFDNSKEKMTFCIIETIKY